MAEMEDGKYGRLRWTQRMAIMPIPIQFFLSLLLIDFLAPTNLRNPLCFVRFLLRATNCDANKYNLRIDTFSFRILFSTASRFRYSMTREGNLMISSNVSRLQPLLVGKLVKAFPLLFFLFPFG